MLPANGPTPPTTATITPSQGGITRRRTAARQSSDITIQPMPWTQPSTDTIALAVGDRRPQQDGVDDRVRVGRVAQDVRGAARDAHASERRHPAQRRVGLLGPGRRGRAATRRARRARRRGVTSTPAGSQARPISIASRLGSEHERLDRQPLGRDRPLLLELAPERLDRVLADLDRAAGAERPAARPTRRPTARAGRRASGRRRRASRTARPARRDASSRTSRSDQRIGCSSSSSRPSAASKPASRAASPSWAGEPRSSSAAIASSAASVRAAGGSTASSRQRLAT